MRKSARFATCLILACLVLTSISTTQIFTQALQTSIIVHRSAVNITSYDSNNNIMGTYPDPYNDYGAYAPPSSTEACIIKLPHNTTYTTNNITLVLTTGCHCFFSFGRYSLDGAPEEKINTDGGYGVATFNTTKHLTDGNHTLHLEEYSLSLEASATVYFIINTSLPYITLQSPQNLTYHNSTIDLNYTLADREVLDAKYSLDNKENVTVLNTPGSFERLQLCNLTDGSHHITLFAADDFGNMYSSEVSFEVRPNPATTMAYGTLAIVLFIAILTPIIAAIILLVFFKRRKSKTT